MAFDELEQARVQLKAQVKALPVVSMNGTHPAAENSVGEGEPVEPTSWTPVDLTNALAGLDIEPPTLCQRSDGLSLLYRGRVHAFQGESESLKSWAAQVAAGQTISSGGNVLYIDFEDDAAGVVSRLLALGLTPEEIAAHFVYIRPDEPLRTRYDEATQAAVDLAGALRETPSTSASSTALQRR